jgi:hypothetical protein
MKRVRKVINNASEGAGESSKMQWSEVKWSEGKGSKLWWGCEGCIGVVKSNEGNVMVKCGFSSSWHNVFHYRYSLVYSVLVLIILLTYSCNCICCFIVCSVYFVVCVVLCAVFCFTVVCYFVWCMLFACCPIVVPLPPGRNPFAV